MIIRVLDDIAHWVSQTQTSAAMGARGADLNGAVIGTTIGVFIFRHTYEMVESMAHRQTVQGGAMDLNMFFSTVRSRFSDLRSLFL